MPSTTPGKARSHLCWRLPRPHLPPDAPATKDHPKTEAGKQGGERLQGWGSRVLISLVPPMGKENKQARGALVVETQMPPQVTRVSSAAELEQPIPCHRMDAQDPRPPWVWTPLGLTGALGCAHTRPQSTGPSGTQIMCPRGAQGTFRQGQAGLPCRGTGRISPGAQAQTYHMPCLGCGPRVCSVATGRAGHLSLAVQAQEVSRSHQQATHPPRSQD